MELLKHFLRFRRRGENSNLKTAEVSQAIIPRRLCSFATGNRVNVEEIKQALISLQKEEQELCLRREISKILSELDHHHQQEQNSSSSSFDSKLNLAKEKYQQLARICGTSTKNNNKNQQQQVEEYKLYRNEKIIGNEWDGVANNRKVFGYSLSIEHWMTPCNQEFEIMVHPSESIPNEEGTAVVQKSIQDFSFGQTREFYCAWSRSAERQVELDFLTSDKFVNALSGANCILANYS